MDPLSPCGGGGRGCRLLFSVSGGEIRRLLPSNACFHKTAYRIRGIDTFDASGGAHLSGSPPTTRFPI